jgi:hypothetical protein
VEKYDKRNVHLLRQDKRKTTNKFLKL